MNDSYRILSNNNFEGVLKLASRPQEGGRMCFDEVIFVFSPIQMVIVSQGDVRYFQHLQGLVSEFIAIQIQNVSVFSHHLGKDPQPNYLLFFEQTPRSCSDLIAVRIHISEFTRKDQYKIHSLNPF